MPRFMIQVESDAGKAEELQALLKFAHHMPEGSYLSMLFTQDLLGWVEEKIRWDFPPDIYSDFEKVRADAAAGFDTLRDQLRDAENAKKQALHDLEEAHHDLANLRTTMDLLKDKLLREQAAYDRSAVRADEVISSLRRRVSLLKRALARFRKIGAAREAKWQFTLDKLRS